MPEDQGVKERIAEFERVLGRSGKTAAEAAQFLRQYGFEAKDIKRVMIDPITGTRQFTAELRKADGIIQRATFAVDRFGNVVGDSGTRFKGFSDMISRNIVKVLEWAVAVGVVYGALSQLNQVFETLVELDEVMSDITITTQETGEALNQYFESAVMVARETGIAVRDVLSVYDDALRATASLDNETERLAVSTALLNDAMTLSRLTGMDIAGAMDALTGAFKQVSAGQASIVGESESVAESFQRGEDVLGTWILAARDGQVALDTFATTFAITGAAAGAAGLDIAELTALTSVLTEGTVKSASEVGNSIRRMITTIQSESGIEALRDIGIAVEDLNGEMRDWDEIMTDLASRRRAGAITDAAFRQVTYALGGGPRGAADVAFTIESWDQVIAKSKEFGNSAAAQEAKEAALAAKSDTLKNAINDLNTSFTELVQTLGTEGGLLDSAQMVLEVLGGIVDGLGLVTEALGPATTRILALAAAMAVLNNTRMGMGLMRGLEGITRGGGQMALGALGGGAVDSLRRTAVTRLATPQMAIATGFAVSQLATEGDAKDKAVRVGTTIAGAVIGSLTPAGPIIGAAIGDAAGNAMLEIMETRRIRLAEVGELDPDQLGAQYTETYKLIQEQLSQFGPLFPIFAPEEARQQADEFLEIYRESGEQAAREFARGDVGAPREGGPAARLEDNLISLAEKIREIEAAQIEAGQTTETQVTAVESLVDARGKEIRRVQDLIMHSKTATRLQYEQLDALEKYAAGELPKKAYKDFGEGVEEALKQGATAFEAFSDAAGVGDEFLGQFLTRYAQMLPEVRDEFMGLVTNAAQLEDALEAAIAGEQVADAASLRLELKKVNREMVVLFETANAFDRVDAFQFRGFTDLSDLTELQFEQIFQRAIELQQQYADDLGITPEDILGDTEEWIAYYADIFRPISEVAQPFIKAAQEEFKEMMTDAEFNLQRLRDIGPERIPELEQRVNFWRQYLSRIPGYEQQAEDQPFNLILGEEDVFHRLITTQEALRFAIEDLTEVEEKQLEGMWNIPEGATVMVPLQSLYYAPKQTGGELALPDVGPYAGAAGDFGLPADKMTTAGDKMDMAADKMLTASELQQQQGFMWQKAVEEFPEGFGPEESMWNKAIQAFPKGGFGPEESPESKLERMLDPFSVDPFKGEETSQKIANAVPPAVKEGFQGVQIEMPPIDARITINIPAIRLNGKAVSSALSIERTSRLSQAARARGMSGGGVIQ